MTPVPRPNVLRVRRRNGCTVWEISPHDARAIMYSGPEVDGAVRYPHRGLYIARICEDQWSAIANLDGFARNEYFLQESFALRWLTDGDGTPTEWFHWIDHKTFFDRMRVIPPAWEARYRYAVDVLRIHQSFS